MHKLKFRFDEFMGKLEDEAQDQAPGDPLGQTEWKLQTLRSLIEYHYLSGCKVSTLIDFYLEDKF